MNNRKKRNKKRVYRKVTYDTYSLWYSDWMLKDEKTREVVFWIRGNK